MPSKSRPRPAKTAVPRRELLRRVAISVDEAREAVNATLGEDLDSATQLQARLWIFGYLAGMSLGAMVAADGGHQVVERLTDRALAAGLDEFLDGLARSPNCESLRDTIAQLRDLVRRLSGDEYGAPRLRLVR